MGTIGTSLRVATCGLILMQAGCGDDPLEPPPPPPPPAAVDVAVSVTYVDGPHIEEGEAGPFIFCKVYLKAEATGAGQATWQEAVFRWYAGADRSTPVDTEVVAAGEIRESWQSGTLAAGQSRAVIWQMVAPVPFAMSITFTYESSAGTGRKTANVGFTCGPSIPPGTPPPEVSAVSVQRPGTPVEPGDTVVVEFTATSPVGVWQTAVVLTGPCTAAVVFSERLDHTVRRTARVPLPSECALGVPITVAALALDAAVQEGVGVTDAGFVLADVTPPTLSITTPIPPLLFAGDSAGVWFMATDNGSVRWLHWELQPAGVRDSLAGSGALWESYLDLVVRATWVSDSGMLVFWAEDGGGVPSDTVRIAQPIRTLATVPRPTVTTVAPGMFRAALVDELRNRIYLLQTEPEVIVILDRNSLAPVATVALPIQGLDFDFTPGGDSLLVTLATRPRLGVVALQGGSFALDSLVLSGFDSTRYGPWFIRTVASGRAFVHLASLSSGPSALLEVSLGPDGTQRIRADAGANGFVGDGYMEVARDRSRLVLNGDADLFQAYDASTDTFGPLRTSVGWGPPGVDAGGTHVLVGSALYDADLSLVRSIERYPPEAARPTILLPAADYVYMTGANAVWRARVSDGRLQDRTRLPFHPGQLHVSASGTTLVATDVVPGYGQTRVAIVDLR